MVANVGWRLKPRLGGLRAAKLACAGWVAGARGVRMANGNSFTDAGGVIEMARRDEHQAAMALVTALRAELAHAANPDKAEPMRAYMKSAMPYLGVAAPQVRAICRRALARRPLASFDDWRAAMLALWREARYREERYAAIELAGDRSMRAYQTLAALPIYEEMIVSGAWWDYVDAVA
ncbi:MAG TPA: DNA alkylation repair protein, partial [Ktedonobacterales bacterium]